MKKIIVFNLVSVDGFFAGLNGEIDWHMVDDEFNRFAIEQTSTFDTILFGRVTYKLFENYWPTVATDLSISKEDREIAHTINSINKIVFSKTLDKVIWENTKLSHKIIPEEIIKLKQQPGKDIVIFGSGTIVQSLTNLNLIDEYRLLLNPVVLGKGKPLFSNMQNKLTLKLLKTKTFKSGNVLLCYKPIK